MARRPDPNARIKLLSAAEAVFGERGLADAKVEEITEHAGVAKGTFYLHFESKEDAFRVLVEAMVARLARYLDDLPGDCPSCCDLQQFLDLWVTNDVEIFSFIWQNRGLMRLLFEGGQSAPYRHLVDQFADRARSKMKTNIRFGINKGLYRADLDPAVAASLIAGAYDRLARQIVTAPSRPDLESLLRQVQVLLLRGIGSASLLADLSVVTRTTKSPVRTPARDRRPAKRDRLRKKVSS